jgi:hypothetical protein
MWCAVFIPAVVGAYQIETVDLATPFDLVTIQDSTITTWHIGELQNFPHTFEFLLTEPTVFSVQVMTVPESPENNRPSTILVKEATRGVDEIMRRTAKNQDWTTFTDPVSDITFIESEPFSTELEPGVYRFEVSSPDSSAQYALKIGTVDTSGYATKVKNIFALRSALGYSVFGAFFNPYVFMPLFVVLSFMFFGWYVLTRQRTNNKEHSN